MSHVGINALQSHVTKYLEYIVVNAATALELEHPQAIMGHECTVLGLSVGYACRSGRRLPPTHVLFKEDAVNKNRRRMIPRLSTVIPQVPPYTRPAGRGVHGRGPRATPASTPVSSNPHPPAPGVRRASMGSEGGGGGASGDGPDSERSPHPRVSCMLALRTSGRAGVGSGSQGLPVGAGSRGHGRACARPGWCQGALVGCMLMVVCVCVPMRPHFTLLESNLRGGLDLVERTGYITRQTGYTSSSRRISSRRRDRSIERPRSRPIAKACQHCLVHPNPTFKAKFFT